jgi:hypothetical protein
MNLSPQQIAMLKMFEHGWGFKLVNDRPGSWNTFWSLKRRGLIANGETIYLSGRLVAVDRLTQKGRDVLAKTKIKELT